MIIKQKGLFKLIPKKSLQEMMIDEFIVKGVYGGVETYNNVFIYGNDESIFIVEEDKITTIPKERFIQSIMTGERAEYFIRHMEDSAVLSEKEHEHEKSIRERIITQKDPNLT